MKLVPSLLHPECVKIPLEATDRHAAINEMCEVFAGANGIADASDLARQVRDREDEALTVLTPGIAFPHASSKLALSTGIAIGALREEVDWGRGQRVHHVFLVIGQRGGNTAEVVARLMMMLGNTRAVKRLRACETRLDIQHFIEHVGVDLDIPHGLRQRAVIEAGQHDLQRLAWSPNGSLASIGGTHEGPVRIWSRTGALLGRIDDLPTPVHCVAWSPSGLHLATGSDDHKIRVWSAETLQCERTIEAGDTLHDLAWSPEGDGVLAAGHTHGVCYLPLDGPRRPLDHGNELAPSLAVSWSHAGGRFAAVGGRNVIQRVVVWSATSLRPVYEEELDYGPIYTIDLSQSGSHLAVGLMSGTVLLYECSTWNQTKIRAHDEQITSVAFSPRGDLLATKSIDGAVRLWQTEDWKLMADLLEPVTANDVQAPLAFSLSEPLLATLGDVGDHIRVWEVQQQSLVPDVESSIRIPQSLVESVRSQRAFLFAGAGISASVLNMVGRDLKKNIIAAIQKDYPTYNGAGQSFEQVMETFCDLNDLPTLQRKLATHIGQQSAPSPSHDLAVQLFSTIVTTNWDMLFERACSLNGIDFQLEVNDHPGVSIDHTPDATRVCQVLKMHGSAATQASIVATAEQLDDYQNSHPNLHRSVLGLIRDRIAVFLGYDMNESHIRRVLATVRADKKKQMQRHFVVGLFNDARAESLRRKGFGVIQCDSGRFLKALKTKADEVD